MSSALHATFAAGLLVPEHPAPAAILGEGGSRERRYAIHRNNTMHALLDAFEQAYPVLRALLGGDCFAQLAREAARAKPPRTPVICEYVQGLPAFVASTPLAATLPYLVDVARIEAECLRVFHAADGVSMPSGRWHALHADPAMLGAARMRLQPASGWLACTHAAADVWLAHMRAERPEWAELDTIDPDHPQDVLVWRNANGHVQVAAFVVGTAAALDALQAGTPLLAALAALPADAAALLLARLVSDDLVVEAPASDRESR
jgi:hypothetical protein